MRTILQEYVERLPHHAKALCALLESKNMEELRQLLHQLKGSGSSYGFPPISSHAESAEAFLVSGEPLLAAEHVRALIGYMEHVEGFARG